MGINPAISLLLVSDTPSYREAVADAVDHCPDLSLTATVVPDDSQPARVAAPADCVLIDAGTDGLSLADFRAALRTHHPTLAVIVAAAESTTLPPSLSIHARVATSDPDIVPELARVVTTTRQRQPSPSVSADQQ